MNELSVVNLYKLLPFLILYFLFSLKKVKKFLLCYSSLFLFSGGLILLLYFLFLISWYAVSYLYLDHVEPNMADVSYLFIQGKPIYHDSEALVRYAFPYGPVAYILNGSFLQLLTPSIFSSKIGGIIAGALSLLFMFMAFRKNLGIYPAFIFLGYLTWIYSNMGNITFWNRPDSYILCFVAASLWIIDQKNKFLVTIGLGLILGILINLKIDSCLFLIPLYLLFYSGFGVRMTVFSIAVGAVTAMLPFIIYNNVNMRDYAACFIFSRFSDFNLFENIKFVLFYIFIPLLSGLFIFRQKGNYRKFYEENHIWIISTILVTIFLIFATARDGSGVHHMIPFILLYLKLFSSFFKEMQIGGKILMRATEREVAAVMSVVFTFSLVAAFITSPIYYAKVLTVSSFLRDNELASRAYKDIVEIMKKYPKDTIEMGYGGQYAYSYFRPALFFRNNTRFPIDAAALMHWAKVSPFPMDTVASLKVCQIKNFLIPRGAEPFDIKNLFSPEQELFPEEFKKAFHDSYERKETTKFYDIWECKE